MSLDSSDLPVAEFPIVSKGFSANISVIHWTALKTARTKATLDMIGEDGSIESIMAQLASDNIKGGDFAKASFVKFDKNYVKFQVASLLSALLLEMAVQNESLELVDELLLEAVADFYECAEKSAFKKNVAIALLRSQYTVGNKS